MFASCLRFGPKIVGIVHGLPMACCILGVGGCASLRGERGTAVAMNSGAILKTGILKWGAAAVIAALTARAEDCGKLAGMKLPHVAITSAVEVSAERGPGVAYCRVQATSRPSADSDILFEVWIPLGAAWNGKFEQVGNGGFAGAIPLRSMQHGVSLGFAVAGTDDGHESGDMTDAAWALNHPEKVKDYGWRAISETTLASKQILRQFKSKAAGKAYFVGCSDGGREALMMAQRFPRYFDGIVAGAPAYAMSRLLTSGALRSARLDMATGHLSAAKLALLQNLALTSCANGARYLLDPRQCRPDLSELKCASDAPDNCLTAAQLATAQLFYQDLPDPGTGGILYGVLPGAEAVKGSWDDWLTGNDDGAKPAGLRFASSYLAYMVMGDPRIDIAQVTNADIARGESHYAPLIDARDPDLSAFRAHGGKLIQYHGWNDPAIAPGYSLEYRARVVAALGAVDDFYRLYMVPGMLHCGGGDAPTHVDWQAAIEAWVEKGTAPGALTASGAQGDTQALLPYLDAGGAARTTLHP